MEFTNGWGESVEITTLASSFILSSIEGLGEVQAEVQTVKSPFQHGSTPQSVTLGERELSLNIVIRGEDREEISNLRKRLGQVFNPLAGEGELVYSITETLSYTIICLPTAVPQYPTGKGVRTDKAQQCTVSLTAYKPFWIDTYDRYTDLIAFSSAFTMPFEFPIVFGEQGASQTIYNTGHVPTPLKIELKGQNASPRIENMTTGKKIQLNRSLNQFETLYINTAVGEKSAYVIGFDGVVTDVMGYLDPESEFFSLEVGENEISYNAVSASNESVATVIWRQRYNAI